MNKVLLAVVTAAAMVLNFGVGVAGAAIQEGPTAGSLTLGALSILPVLGIMFYLFSATTDANKKSLGIFLVWACAFLYIGSLWAAAFQFEVPIQAAKLYEWQDWMTWSMASSVCLLVHALASIHALVQLLVDRPGQAMREYAVGFYKLAFAALGAVGLANLILGAVALAVDTQESGATSTPMLAAGVSSTLAAYYAFTYGRYGSVNRAVWLFCLLAGVSSLFAVISRTLTLAYGEKENAGWDVGLLILEAFQTLSNIVVFYIAFTAVSATAIDGSEERLKADAPKLPPVLMPA